MPKLFLSHMQDEMGREAMALYNGCAKLGLADCWLDVYQSNKSIEGMEKGVKECDVLVAMISNNYLSRDFCQKELMWAMQYGKLVFPVVRMTDKPNINRFRSASPASFMWLFDTNINNLDCSDMELFETMLPTLVKRALDPATAKPAPPLSRIEKSMQQLSLASNDSPLKEGTYYIYNAKHDRMVAMMNHTTDSKGTRHMIAAPMGAGKKHIPDCTWRISQSRCDPSKFILYSPSHDRAMAMMGHLSDENGKRHMIAALMGAGVTDNDGTQWVIERSKANPAKFNLYNAKEDRAAALMDHTTECAGRRHMFAAPMGAGKKDDAGTQFEIYPAA